MADVLETNAAGKWFRVAFAGLLIATAAEAFWVVLAHKGMGFFVPPVVVVQTYVVAAFAVGAAVFFKAPWLAVVVAWVDAVLIWRNVGPIGEIQGSDLIRDFGWVMLYFVAAHLGLALWAAARRRRVVVAD